MIELKLAIIIYIKIWNKESEIRWIPTIMISSKYAKYGAYEFTIRARID